MGHALTYVLAAVILGGSFGSASATVESLEGDAMVVEIEVEVLANAESVVAHLTFDEERLTLPLLDRGGGTFALRTELEAKNYVVVFETIGDGGESSEATTLARLGADLGPEREASTTTTIDDEGLSEESQRLLWLAIALGAASLSLIAFWVLGSRDQDEDADLEPTDLEPDGETAGEEE